MKGLISGKTLACLSIYFVYINRVALVYARLKIWSEPDPNIFPHLKGRTS